MRTQPTAPLIRDTILTSIAGRNKALPSLVTPPQPSIAPLDELPHVHMRSKVENICIELPEEKADCPRSITAKVRFVSTWMPCQPRNGRTSRSQHLVAPGVSKSSSNVHLVQPYHVRQAIR